MARPLRIKRRGAWHHVTARGIERKEIFRKDPDRRHWLELLPEFVHTFRLRLHAGRLDGKPLSSAPPDERREFVTSHFILLISKMRQICSVRKMEPDIFLKHDC